MQPATETHVLHVVGARPNFMKVAPVTLALGRIPQVRQTLVHTGQHYDVNMSDVFFRELGICAPDANLGVGSGSHARQTGEIMQRLETVVLESRPDWVLVYGDVNSTVAAALVCTKLLVRVAHVEAGLRSFDRTMPEEINRLVTDQLSDILFTPSEDGCRNLSREGIASDKVHLVGNVMIDTLVRMLPAAEQRWRALQECFSLRDGEPYGLVTLHRPSNVDDGETIGCLWDALNSIARRRLRLMFPMHPRTRQCLGQAALGRHDCSLKVAEPLGYLDFLALEKHATVVITDSGGIQEETTFLSVPCLTLRDNTERPVTVEMGTNILVGRDMARLEREVTRILDGEARAGCIPPMWDGHAAGRIASVLLAGRR